MTGYGAGAEMYITKPFVAEQLMLQIKNMIAYRKPTLNIISNKRIQQDEKKINEREQIFIDKLNFYLEENLNNPDYYIEDLCKDIGTSRMQLHRKLIAIIGESASDYIRSFKMAKAQDFLQSGNYNVSEAAFEVGFKSNSHFTKLYKKVFGYVPSDEINKQTNQHKHHK